MALPLLGFLVPLVGAVITIRTVQVAARLTVTLALIALFSAALLEARTFIADQIEEISFTAPLWVEAGLALLPPNVPTVITSIAAVEGAIAIWRYIRAVVSTRLFGI